MALTLYNTMTRRVEEFVPLVPGRATMYTCGPTVYNYFHIGNARSFVMADVLRRYLQYRGYEVTFVMNITDVDDRIIKTAIEQGTESSAVAAFYTEAFLADIARLGIHPADAHPRATGHIEGIVDHIVGLIDRGAAYELDGDVYFRVAAFPAYGKLSGKRLEDLQAGARVEADLRKENPGDFALWKAAKPGEPSWPSPWGPGRPGWHIECSVMSRAHLGDTFDIHAGGNDLIFPHHENEIAQSEALTGAPFARMWVHFGFLNIDNEKMSKSLGNIFTAREILDKVPVEALRFFYLQTHYRAPLNFTPDGLEASGRGLQKLQALYDALRAPGGEDGDDFDPAPHLVRFVEAMDADLNAPAALGTLFDLMRDANAVLHGPRGMAPAARAALRDALERTAGGVFGLLREEAAAAPDDALFSDVMQVIVDVRRKARDEKQWEMSDYIRDRLRERGIVLEDGRDGTTWRVER